MWRQGSSRGTGVVARPMAAPSSELGGGSTGLVGEEAWISQSSPSQAFLPGGENLVLHCLKRKAWLVNSSLDVLRLLPLYPSCRAAELYTRP